MQINRLLDIVYYLLAQSGRQVTAKDLSDRFGVSQRTIYRDVDTLSLAGIPVITEKGRTGGIRLVPGFVLSKSLLNESEQNAILAAMQGLSGIGPTEGEQALEKLSAIFNKTVTNWLSVDFSNWDFTDGRLFEDLKTAILGHRLAEFSYYGRSGEKTNRKIEPYQLYFKCKAWYLIGFCLERDDMRMFKLSRIKDLKVLDTDFKPRETEKKNDSDESPALSSNVTIKLRIQPEMSYRIFDEFAGDKIERQDDGSYIVTACWPEDEWFYGTILSYGDSAEVLEPERIRAAVRDKGRNIAAKYN